MAKALSTTERLKRVLAQWRSWQGGPGKMPRLVRALDGRSNDSFLVAAGAERFVVRINHPARALGVDREAELQILADIAAQDFAPCVVFGDEETLVTRYVPGTHPERACYRCWLPEAGRLFRAIHTTPTRVTTTLDPLRHAVSYFEALASPEPVIASCLESLLQGPRRSPDTLCLCHNDLLFGNLISNADGWVAIDWEYAALGDPAFDLAVLLETLAADEADVAILLDAYGSQEIRGRLDNYRRLYRLIEVLWWRLKSPQESGGTDLAELASRFGLASPAR